MHNAKHNHLLFTPLSPPLKPHIIIAFPSSIKTMEQTTTPTSSHRSRGRPQGSRNKSKPPVVIAQGTCTALHSNLFEIPPDTDIVSSIHSFARVRRRGVSVLSASGYVTNVALRQADGTVVSLKKGRFEILCLNGAVLPPPSPAEASGMSVVLVGEDGWMVGGKVAGEMVAVGTVMVVGATFRNLRFQRLPLMEGEGEVGEEDGMDLKVVN